MNRRRFLELVSSCVALAAAPQVGAVDDDEFLGEERDEKVTMPSSINRKEKGVVWYYLENREIIYSDTGQSEVLIWDKE